MIDSDISIRIRTNRALKNQAAKELRKMGLTVSDAIRLYLSYIANEKKLPNELTNSAVLISIAKERKL
ncbi:MAG: type II toxin-antitoxin system RelB/DinJ family antitoxin [Haemophilus parainfluenzae]|jgi:addiction module antitoxin, relB/dinJ family|nr:type II toxin-antitoxin system RelB/DinJ family antitoxin [Haemophilus parainfluenzae]